jgi:hypothetical protein
MKHCKTVAIVVAGGLVAVCGLAIAKVHTGNASGHGHGHGYGSQQRQDHHGDPASMAAHLAQFFPKIATFDTDKNFQLDEQEKESLGKAIADGTVEFPAGHMPPHGDKPDVAMMVDHIGEVYPQVARYDANHDRVLDETEQAALKSAIEKGELAFTHGEQSQVTPHK